MQLSNDQVLRQEGDRRDEQQRRYDGVEDGLVAGNLFFASG